MKRIKYVPSKEVRIVVLLLKMAAFAVVIYYVYMAISLSSMMSGPTPVGAPSNPAPTLIPAILGLLAGFFFASVLWALALLVSFTASIAHHAEESVVFQQHILEGMNDKDLPKS